MTDKHFHGGTLRPSSMNSTHRPSPKLHVTTEAKTNELPKAVLEDPETGQDTYQHGSYPHPGAGGGGSYPTSSIGGRSFRSTQLMQGVNGTSRFSAAASRSANQTSPESHGTHGTTHRAPCSGESHQTGPSYTGSASGGGTVVYTRDRSRPPTQDEAIPVLWNPCTNDRSWGNTHLRRKENTPASYGRTPSSHFPSGVDLEGQNHRMRKEISDLQAKLKEQKAYSTQLAHTVGQWQSAYDRAPDHFRFSEASPVRGGDLEQGGARGGGTVNDPVGYYRDELERATVYACTLEAKIAGLEGYIEAMERLLKQYVTDDVSRTMRRHDRSGGK
ncbi:hypothetical protein DB88DRAFT_473729 [Papiliotrema laurentii]|uniref:Uncharacterized protein n=1 Tax=Papiliotrema laurentii TaxID=5418 RepID=A0AAD9FP46_PAPLA|nr:hypothetical protein DB88DRAFT_473729 [Papiliotrema laurentii]